MNQMIMLGIGDIGASRTAGELIKTLGLGSCVAVIFLDPAVRAVGMAHVALPESSVSPEKAALKPGYFADTGIPALIQAMRKVGSTSDPASYLIKLAGGAQVMDPNNTFNVGHRNVLAIRRQLWQLGAGPVAEDVGGHFSRSVSLDVNTGSVRIHSPAKGDWTI